MGHRMGHAEAVQGREVRLSRLEPRTGRSFGLDETRITKRVRPLKRPRHLLCVRVGDFEGSD